MKKIGILTFWNVPNYGAFLQAYALQKIIDSKIENADVRQIAYLDRVHYNLYYGMIPKGYNHYVINPKFYKELVKNIWNRKKTIELKEKICEYYSVIKNTGDLSISELEKTEFDCVVLGSDIIWDYSIQIFNHDVHLFGNRINAESIISYAPSFGTVKDCDEVPDYVKEGLSSLSNISVRDKNSAELVKKIVNREATIVADPTFVWNFNNDPNIPPRREEDDYILVYGSFFSKKLVEGAKKYARVNNLKIICVDSFGDDYDWCDKIIRQDDLTPFEWCAFFRDAKVVMTCTYHGLMFGLIFNKKIVFHPTQFILDKANSLIEQLELRDVLVEYGEFEQKVKWNWNFDVINKRIDKLREESTTFLLESIR